MRVKAIQYAINSALPEELRDYQRPLDGKGIERLMHQVAVSHPDKYATILKHIGDLGRNAAYWQGETMGLDDLRGVIDTPGYLKQMDTEVAAATRNLRDPQAIREARENVWHKWASKLERDTMSAALVKNNAIGESVASGARGKPLQARAMLSTPALFEDSQGRTIPLFARTSYSQGVTPGAWLAGTYGARKAVVSTKVSTAKGGFLAKMLAQVAAPLIVTEQDCGTTNGIDLSKDAPDLRNRFLATPAGGLDSGSLLDRKGIAQIKNKLKGDTVVVRSALTCQAPRGVCAKCIGADPRGQLHPVGYAAGTTASNALGEPATQAALSEKHTSGAASKKASYSGLDWLQRFVQVPDSFPDRAPVAERDGTVTVMEAPQGGHYVHVGDQEHYVPAGLAVTVKTGEQVEAGQPLSEGVVRPDDVVRLRGVGEGRRYYSDRLGQMFADSGFKPDPRNVELIARAAVDHVQIDDPEDLPDGVLPDDVVQFGEFMRNYEPASGSQVRDIKDTAGQYLQQPALHYTPGTKLTGSMVARLGKAGITKVMTNEKAPPFHPSMVRLQTSSFSNPDWLASLSTSYLGKQLSTGAMRGQDTNIEHNIHFAPRLAAGIDFGKNIETTGEF